MTRIVAGPRAVREAVSARPGDIAVVYADRVAARRALRPLVEDIRARGVRVELRDRAELDGLAERHQGIVAIAGEYRYAALDEALAAAGRRALLVALDEITDPHNLGAIVRSAVAFGADAVLTLRDRAAPVTAVVVRASAGATEHARIVRVTNLARALAELRERGLSVVGLAPDGAVPIDALPEAPGGRVLVIGSEGGGMRRLVREQCDVVARIALCGPVESLNASVAAGIALYAAAMQR